MRFKILMFVTAALAFSVGLALLPGRVEARETASELTGCVGCCFKCKLAVDEYQVDEPLPWEVANDMDEETVCGDHVACRDTCNETFAHTALELGRHIASRDVEAFTKLLERTPNIEVNIRRKAVQVIGCNDAIVASIPITDRLLAAAGPYVARPVAYVE